MPRRRFLLLLLPLCSALFCFLTLEIAVRMMTRCDADGDCRFRATRLKPYRLPIRRAEEQLAAYRASANTALIYDPELGWSQRPGVSTHNVHGFITTAADVAREPVAGRLRVALLGDSFTQGNYRFGWWRVLEEQLRAAGVECEILNFGVGGYGMDQAALRWSKDAKAWRPQIVVFGFFAEDCYRNVNLLRLIRDPDSGIPFFKPRFVLEGSALRLINSPTPQPEAIGGILRELARDGRAEAVPLAAHEWFFQSSDFQMNVWRWSRLAALMEAKFELMREAARAEDFYRLEANPAQLALRIVSDLRREVESTGAYFVVVHQPGLGDLGALKQAGAFPYEALYGELKRQHPTIQPERGLLEAAAGKDLRALFRDAHYGPELNAVVGKTVADFLGALEGKASSRAPGDRDPRERSSSSPR